TLPLKITAGTATITDEIVVHDIELAFPNLDDVNVNSNTPLTIQATSDFGTLAGLTLDVAVHRGSISEKQVILDDQGHATVIYDAGHYPGFAQLSAKVAGTSKIHTQEFFVKNVGDYLERNVLVTNGTGTIDVDGVSHAYSGTTNLVIQAAPGEVIEPSLADIFEPPVYALQDYALGNQVGSDVKLLD